MKLRLIIYGVLMVDLVFCSIGDGNNIALLYVKHHPHVLLHLTNVSRSFCKRLQSDGDLISNSRLYQAIISKETDR